MGARTGMEILGGHPGAADRRAGPVVPGPSLRLPNVPRPDDGAVPQVAGVDERGAPLLRGVPEALPRSEVHHATRRDSQAQIGERGGHPGHQIGDCSVGLIGGDSQEAMRVAREHDRLVGHDALRSIVGVADRRRQHDGALFALPRTGQHDVLLKHARLREDRRSRLEGGACDRCDATEEMLSESLEVRPVRERARGDRDQLTADSEGADAKRRTMRRRACVMKKGSDAPIDVKQAVDEGASDRARGRRSV